MNKHQEPGREGNNIQTEKVSPVKNNEEQVRQNPVNNDQQSAEHKKNEKLIPMHEEDTLGNP